MEVVANNDMEVVANNDTEYVNLAGLLERWRNMMPEEPEECICHRIFCKFLISGEDNEHFKCVDKKIIHTRNHEGNCCIDLERLAKTYIHDIGNFLYSFMPVNLDIELITAYKYGPFAKKIHLYRMLTNRHMDEKLLGCRHLEDISLIPFINDEEFDLDVIMELLLVKIDTKGRSLCHNADASMFCIHRLCDRYPGNFNMDQLSIFNEPGFCLNIKEVTDEYIKKTEFNIDPVQIMNYYMEVLSDIISEEEHRTSSYKETHSEYTLDINWKDILEDDEKISELKLMNVYQDLSVINDINDIIHFILLIAFSVDNVKVNSPLLTLLMEDFSSRDENTKRGDTVEIVLDPELHDVSNMVELDTSFASYIIQKYCNKLSELIWISSKEVLKNSSSIRKTKKGMRY